MFDSLLIRMSLKFYRFLIRFGTNMQSLLLLYMRLTWGHEFFLVGLHKFERMEETIQFFQSLSISHPSFHAPLVAFIELAGGLLLILGLASRLAAIPLICVMIGALSTAHAEHVHNLKFILDPTSLAAQSPYPYLITALLVLAFGPGRISLDGWLKRRIKAADR